MGCEEAGENAHLGDGMDVCGASRQQSMACVSEGSYGCVYMSRADRHPELVWPNAEVSMSHVSERGYVCKYMWW